MNVSKLIELLDGHMKKYGDLPVKICTMDFEGDRDIQGVFYTTTEDEEKFISLQNFD